jgi:hypothetical protein
MSGALDSFECREAGEIFSKPALQVAPLAQKGFMSGFDGNVRILVGLLHVMHVTDRNTKEMYCVAKSIRALHSIGS